MWPVHFSHIFNLIVFPHSARLLSSLKGNAFSDVDTQEVDKFIKQISAYKYRCEDERAKAVAHGGLRSGLKPQPPGPMTMWQAEAFSYLIDNAKENDSSLQQLEPTNDN